MAPTQVYILNRPSRVRLPLIISAPHVGTEIPEPIRSRLRPPFADTVPDTDWFVHQLYSFSEEIGAVLIHASLSRYVVDLNRPASGPSLYNDARLQTAVVPTNSFAGEALYDEDKLPTPAERNERIARYHQPYYEALGQLLRETKTQFGRVLLFDAHSIARFVPTIRSELFPDMIVGDRDGTSAHPSVGLTLLNELRAAGFDVTHNNPFKGGEITRHHGRPAEAQHAVQLEMSQDIYMSDGKLDPAKLARVQPVLKKALCAMAEKVSAL